MKTDITVYNAELKDQPFTVLLHNLQMGWNAIPEQYRAEAKVKVHQYEGEWSQMVVTYERPLTPEEIEANAAHEKRIADVYKEKRRAMLEELKKEFGDE